MTMFNQVLGYHLVGPASSITEELAPLLLKKCFAQDAMTPGQAANKTGVTCSTANRYYNKWSDEIRQSLERKLVPNMEKSITRLAKKTNGRARSGDVAPRAASKR